MSRTFARLLLLGVIALLIVPVTAAASVPAPQLPDDIPIDLPDEDLPIDLPDEDEEEPTEDPTGSPEASPSSSPTVLPTELPTVLPTEVPTEVPTVLPTAEPNEAALVNLPSAVWVAYVKKTFIGAVTSEQPLCQVGRTVVVKRIVRGGARVIGKAETGLDATWTMKKATTKPGRYVAKVLPMSLEAAKCLGDRSVAKRI